MTEYWIEQRTAAKPHTCRGCGLGISPGEDYYHQDHLRDGLWESMKFCTPCQQLLNDHQPEAELYNWVLGYHSPAEIVDSPELLAFVRRVRLAADDFDTAAILQYFIEKQT